MCTGTTAAYVPSSSTALRCAQNQCKHIWRQYGQKTSSVDDEYAAHTRSSITAESADTDLVTDVHWNLSICAQVPVQRSDVQNTNASTSEYADETSSVDGEI